MSIPRVITGPQTFKAQLLIVQIGWSQWSLGCRFTEVDDRQISEKLFGAWICQDKYFDFFYWLQLYIYWTANRHTLWGSIQNIGAYQDARVATSRCNFHLVYPFPDIDWKIVSLYLVDFDCSINFSDEPIASKESNSSSKKKNINRHNECITKINNCGGETFKRQLCSVIMTGINEEVYRCETGCQKTKIGRWKFEKYIYGFYLRHHHR